MASQQRAASSPARQLPAFALRSLHHPRGPPLPELPHTDAAALTQTHHAAVVDVHFAQPAEDTRVSTKAATAMRA